MAELSGDWGQVFLHLVTATAGEAGAPDLTLVLAAALLAVLLTLPFGWLVVHLITAAHEGGHALASALQGAEVEWVRLNRDRTGATKHAPVGRLGDILVTLAGYSSPPFFGVLGAVLVTHGSAAPVLWITFGGLVLLLLVSANWFGRFILAVFAFIFLLLAIRTSSAVQVVAACTWTWLLLFGGLSVAVQHGAEGGDQNLLRQKTRIPASLWAWLFDLFALAALIYGGLLLFGVLQPPL